MSDRVFVDTNVILRYLLRDHPVKSAAARFFDRLRAGEVVAVISDTVLFEAVYVIEKQHGINRAAIREGLIEIVTLPSIELPDVGMYAEVLRRYVEHPALSFADCFHIVLARKLADGRLVTFDKAAGKAEGVDWIEPT